MATVALCVQGCSFSPLTNRIKVGEEAFVVFVAEGIDNNTDLFVSLAAGGVVTQLTYTAAVERTPRMSPEGGVLAFIRERDAGDPRPTVVAMNLLNGAERSYVLPANAGTPRSLGWSREVGQLHVQTERGTWTVPTLERDPAILPVAENKRVAADSAFEIWLGEPRFARAVMCANALCVIGPSGNATALAPSGSGALRWGSDSVAWFENQSLVVRALGPGPARRVTWRRAPDNPRDATYGRGRAWKNE